MISENEKYFYVYIGESDLGYLVNIVNYILKE
jgi:hypothetical protein